MTIIIKSVIISKSYVVRNKLSQVMQVKSSSIITSEPYRTSSSKTSE